MIIINKRSLLVSTIINLNFLVLFFSHAREAWVVFRYITYLFDGVAINKRLLLLLLASCRIISIKVIVFPVPVIKRH
jgi:hypothetical protein